MRSSDQKTPSWFGSPGLSEGTAVADAIRDLAAAIPVARVELRRPTLEDVFVQIVTESRGGSPEEARTLRTSLRDEPVQELGP